MATRFYLPGAGTTSTTPTPDASWEVTTGFVRYPLMFSKSRDNNVAAVSNTKTVPITTTQDILAAQFISAPLKAQSILGTFSLVIRVSQNATTVNATLACVVRLVDSAGATRATLYAVYGTDTAYPLAAAPATRIINAQNITAATSQTGDRIVVEIGNRATAPTTSDTVIHRSVNDATLADYALTTALTTSINPWCEFSQDLFGPVNNNYQSIIVGDGMSTGERIR